MEETTERLKARALAYFGEGELEVNHHGNVFWRMPDGRLMALGYTVFEAEDVLIELTNRLDAARAANEEEE